MRVSLAGCGERLLLFQFFPLRNDHRDHDDDLPEDEDDDQHDDDDLPEDEDDDQHDDDDLPEEEEDDHRQDRQAMMTEASQEREIASFPPLAAALINTRKYWGCSEYE